MANTERRKTSKALARQERTEQLVRERMEITEQIEKYEAEGELDGPKAARLARLRRRVDEINTELVELHRPLVLHYVSRFKSHSDQHASEDFYAAGMVGLYKAIGSYNPDLGSTFASWAYQPIKREVLAAVHKHEYPHLSRADFDQRDQIIKAIKALRQLHPDVDPTDEEVAVWAGCRVAQVQRVRQSSPSLSLQASVSNANDSETEIGDFLEDTSQDVENQVITGMSLEALQEYGLACLNWREMFVLVRRFGLDGEPPEKLQSIGRALGISREAARQNEAKARAKLNHPVVLQYLISGGKPPASHYATD